MGKGGRCVRLTTDHHPLPLSRNLGTLTSWNPLGHSRPVTGLIYHYLLLHFAFSTMYISLRSHYDLGLDPACNRKGHQDYFVGGEDGRCVRLTTLPISRAVCPEILEAQPPGTLWPVISLHRNHLLSMSKHTERGIAYWWNG